MKTIEKINKFSTYSVYNLNIFHKSDSFNSPK